MKASSLHLILVYLVLSSSACETPADYQEIGSIQYDGTYNSINFINQNTGWVVGNGGLLFYTDDEGKTWIKKEINTTDDLIKVLFIDENHGWIASGSTIWHTNDGCISWTEQLVDSSLSRFVDMIFIDRNTGWVSGPPGGVLYYTSDGGDTWSDRSVETSGRIVGLSFVSENLGWSVGADSRVYKTTNGGLTWTENNSPRFSHSISFVDSLVGFVGNVTWASSNSEEYCNIFKTVDGGNTWTTQAIPRTTRVHKLSFFDSENGFAVIGWDVIYTTNGGENWQSVLNLPANLGYPDLSIVNGGDVFILSLSGEVFRYTLP